MRTLFVAFLVGHAAVHAVMWTLPFTDAIADMPFNPARSWLWGDSRVTAVVLAGLATGAFAVTAVGYGLDTGWWPPSMLVAAAVSVVLMLAYFSPWWSVGILLSGGLAVYAWQTTPAL